MKFAHALPLLLLSTLLAGCARPPKVFTPQERAKAAETAQALDYFASRRMLVVADGGRADPVRLIDIKKWGDRYYVQYNAGRGMHGGENLIDVVQNCSGSVERSPWLQCQLYNGVNSWNSIRIATATADDTIVDTAWIGKVRPMSIHSGQLRVTTFHSPAYGVYVAQFID